MEQHTAAAHHAEAAFNHGRAVEYHREAGHHYLLGKDYAHAAHQALAAHGHGLLALRNAKAAGKFYAGFEAAELPPPEPVAPKTALTIAELHEAAALQHEEAARNHLEAMKHEAGERAAKAEQAAYRHARQALFHGDEAAMVHIEHYGKAGPSAELV